MILRIRNTSAQKMTSGVLTVVIALTIVLSAFDISLADERRPSPVGSGDGSIAGSASALPLLAISADLPRPLQKPPLPFSGPLVGPVIKRTTLDDIEHRTTAFLPTKRQLNKLTPIDSPDEDRWIRVDLSEQIVIVYENGRPLRGFVISSGLPSTPTVLGEYRIGTKVRAQTMSGGSGASFYSLPNVQWVQYFYGDYSFHSTYWHSDFGKPKSRGCINMTTADAKWLFDWAGPVWDHKSAWFRSSANNPGTLVIVHE